MTPLIRGRTVERARVARSIGSAPPPNVVVGRVRGAAERVDSRTSRRPGGADAGFVSDANPYPSLVVFVPRRLVVSSGRTSEAESSTGTHARRYGTIAVLAPAGFATGDSRWGPEYRSESGVGRGLENSRSDDDHLGPFGSPHTPHTVPVAVRIRSVGPHPTPEDECRPLSAARGRARRRDRSLDRVSPIDEGSSPGEQSILVPTLPDDWSACGSDGVSVRYVPVYAVPPSTVSSARDARWSSRATRNREVGEP